MIRTVLAWFILRAADRARPVFWPARALIARSAELQRLQRNLRAVDVALRTSTPGLITEPPPWLAPRTLARVHRLPAASPTRALLPRPFAILAAVGGLGALAAAALTAAVLLRAPSITPAPATPQAPLTDATPALPPALPVSPVPPAPEVTVAAADNPPSFFAAVLSTTNLAASSDPLSGPLLAEARRLRDDTQAAASFVLDRLRLIGASTEQ